MTNPIAEAIVKRCIRYSGPPAGVWHQSSFGCLEINRQSDSPNSHFAGSPNLQDKRCNPFRQGKTRPGPHNLPRQSPSIVNSSWQSQISPNREIAKNLFPELAGPRVYPLPTPSASVSFLPRPPAFQGHFQATNCLPHLQVLASS